MIAHITDTIEVICKHVEEAEKQVRQAVLDFFPGAAEEQITTLFQEKLSQVLVDASGRGEIAKAFAKDLRKAGLPTFGGEPFRLSQGLVAEVSWHPRHVEGKTGGDFGLILVRPKIERGIGGIVIRAGEATGLLAQAKRQLHGQPFGTLTASQESVLADRLDFTSLVLYRFTDWENRKLDPFGWRRCTGGSVEAVNGWLRGAHFSRRDVMTTTEVLRDLERDKIGTNDRNTLDSVVVPPATPTMRVEIKWAPGEEPSSTSFVLVKPRTDAHAQVNQTG